MAGRALFFRFLIDRKIVLASEREEICPASDGLKDAFANAEKAAQTSAWLDETFNGDFLRLIDESIPAADRAARQEAYRHFYLRIERRAGKRFFHHLHAILNGWRGTGGVFQHEVDWGDLDFAHIPVGVLSQVYESFSHRADPVTARETSVHYTPRTIARLMVDQAFAAVPDPAQAMVLDPACGAGIFLVLALRRLVSERWQLDQKRPNTRIIQSILYRQLRGFDVSESALRLAALALYITAIELNGTQRPPDALKFPKDLRKGVLFHFRDDSPDEAVFSFGSLGPRVPPEFDGAFDLVIGNPPWTRLREEELESTGHKSEPGKAPKTAALNAEFTRIGQRVLRERGFGELAKRYKNPDKNPDLPFLWRAAEWAKKPTGVISLALPARLIGRTSGKGHAAWMAILKSLSVTGLINGADLRKTSVWESMDIPFCLLFARNTAPPPDHRFMFAAPLREPGLNQQSRFRLDYETAKPVSVERIERQPWVLKTLSLGTWRDVAVMEKLLRAFPQSLAAFWKEWNPEEDKTGQGFNLSPGLAQESADFLADLKVFAQPGDGISLEVRDLETFLEQYGQRTAHRPRTKNLFQPPLLIVPQSPGADQKSIRAYLFWEAVAFSQSNYGYSCAGHPEAETLAALLYLLSHSTLFSYFCLMSSRRAGFDRQTFNKEEFDAIPFPDPLLLAAPEKSAIQRLARELESNRVLSWEAIDSFLFRLYGLDDEAAQTVRDTLFSAMSYRRQGSAALDRTTQPDREPFRQELCDLLAPYFHVCGEQVFVEETRDQPDQWEQPWFFLALSRAPESVAVSPSLLRKAMQEANERSASRIFVRLPGKRGLLLGLLNERRWWTITRARLCGQAILRQHLDAFGLPETV
ncbi:MAG: N-6 DNA methylase [Acidobacteriota bacterium]